MAKVVATFEKVSYDQFEKDMKEKFPTHEWEKDHLRIMWENIETPKRSTWHSAGYDFKAPFAFDLAPGTEIVIPTGIRAVFSEMDWDLDILPRSGSGFKYGIRLANTVGIIDADYSYADNSGHIMVKLRYETNPTFVSTLMKWGTRLGFFKKMVHFNEEDAFCQGIFRQYGVTSTDANEPKKDRTGGFGSTDTTTPIDCYIDARSARKATVIKY